MSIEKKSSEVVTGTRVPGGTLKFSVVDRINSFRCAIKGIRTMLRYEHNAWIHSCITLAVLVTGLSFGFSRFEWCWIVLAIMAVWAAEALNTALEFMADVASPGFHPMIERAKDVAAGAVLISSIGSVVIGLLIIGPYVLRLLERA
jgi:diacylglycerol kinase (ATP)